jgi:hypothetical protein
VLAVAERDADFTLYAFRASWFTPGPADRGYAKLATAALLKAIGDEEKRQVDANCGGKYSDQEICGQDFDPFTCAQDGPGKPYLYKTTATAADAATIGMRWPEGREDTLRYRMVKRDGRWLLDGIDCGSIRYHMP